MKNITIFSMFIKSIYSVKHIAKFRFAGIGKTLQYVFFLALLYFLPGLIQALAAGKDSSILVPGFDFDTGSLMIILPIYILFMYIFNAGVIIFKITVLAAIALLLAKILKRNLPYRQSWRLTAFSITFTTFSFGVLALFDLVIPGALIIDLAVSLIYICASILKIPKPKNK
ncbi:DUF1189 family protein [Bacillus sp. FSL K6-3431]|uniref:DUF1189 family protein n=1 Tax=Bacillus sp. FSL K6-3431 TaxID=2921500 RepID=UPI0030F6A489